MADVKYNVDGYEFYREGEFISLKFADVFGDGTVYQFHLDDIKKIVAGLQELLEL